MGTVRIEITVTGKALTDIEIVLLTLMRIESDENGLQESLEDAFDEGFEQGYDTGYADGVWKNTQEDTNE